MVGDVKTCFLYFWRKKQPFSEKLLETFTYFKMTSFSLSDFFSGMELEKEKAEALCDKENTLRLLAEQKAIEESERIAGIARAKEFQVHYCSLLPPIDVL